MFKEYTVNGHQNMPLDQQARVGVDLTTVTSYTRTPSNSLTRLTGPGLNMDVYMTKADYDEFITNLKTANRLKRVYE